MRVLVAWSTKALVSSTRTHTLSDQLSLWVGGVGWSDSNDHWIEYFGACVANIDCNTLLTDRPIVVHVAAAEMAVNPE